MTFETICHTPSYIVAIEVFPVSNAMMAATAFKLRMLLMGKFENIFETMTLALGVTRLLKMAKPTVSFFTSFKMTFKTALLSGSTEGVINFGFLRKHATSSGIDYRRTSQRLPAGWHTWRGFGCTDLAINMTGGTTH